MARITLKIRNALVQVLKTLHQAHPKGVLMYGFCASSKESFCRVVCLDKCADRLLSCTRLSISHFSHFEDATAAFCDFLKGSMRSSACAWWNLVSKSRWLEYNVDKDLYCLNLGIGTVDYYILLRREYLDGFRKFAFNHG